METRIGYPCFPISLIENGFINISTTDVFSKGNPEKIFEGNYFLPFERRFDIHPDGDRFIMIQSPEAGLQEQKIFVIQNFDEELMRLVPVM